MREQRGAERRGAFSALYDVTAVASASLDLATILDHALDRIVAVLVSEAAAIHLVEGTPAALRLAAARGIPAAILAQGDPLLREPKLGRAAAPSSPPGGPRHGRRPPHGAGVRRLPLARGCR